MPAPTDVPAAAIEKARRHYRLRRLRDHEFGPALFGEPAWDILLDLYIAASDPRLASIMSASMAASVSTQETARWLILLEALTPLIRTIARQMAKEDFERGQAFLRTGRPRRRSFSPIDPN